MSGNKNKGQFSSQYIISQSIKEHKDKSVFIVKNIKDDHYYIAKKMSSSSSYLDREVEVLKRINDHHIVKLFDVIEENGFTYLIEEYCQQGDLRNYLSKRFKGKSYLKQLVLSKWLLQILIGLQSLHKNNIMHRDIRPQNIFLTHEGNIKLGSFKSSKIFQNQNELAKTMIKSPYYLGGQCTSHGGYNCKADIWAFGCLIYEICSLHKLTPGNKSIEMTSRMIQKEGMKDIPEAYSKKLNELYRSCFQPIDQRPSSSDLLRDDYFFNRLKQLITERKSHPERIPIKKYEIHLKQLAKKRQQEPINLLKTLREKKNEKGLKVLLPKIDRPPSSNKRKKSKQSQDRAERIPSEKNKLIRVGSREKQRPDSKSKQLVRIHSRERQRSKSKELYKKTANTSLNLNNNFYDSPVLGKKIEMVGSLGSGKRVSTEKSKAQMIKSQQFVESPKPKVSLMAPPLLPKPSPKIDDAAKLQSLKKKKQVVKTESQQKIVRGQQIEQTISKIFKDLNLQDYDQILILQEDQENEARLTQKKDEERGLIKAYAQKLLQIEKKYEPEMSTIFEKTNQFDSNTFGKVKYLENNQFL